MGSRNGWEGSELYAGASETNYDDNLGKFFVSDPMIRIPTNLLSPVPPMLKPESPDEVVQNHDQNIRDHGY